MSEASLVALERWEQAEDIAPPLDAYYDSSRKEYVMRNDRGNWLSHSAGQFTMLLRTKGAARNREDAQLLMTRIIDTRDVAYTGRLAGHQEGFHEANGVRMLITSGPQLAEPTPGEWPFIHALLTGLLAADPEHGELQLVTLYCWVQSAFEAVRLGQWRPGHILALAGPPGSGKSLLQRLITECLGGRVADAFRYLSGLTQFNRDLFGAEHLVIDDAQASTDYRTRMQMAAHLKALAVVRDHSCHGKGLDALTLRPIWRCSISLNDEGECLLVLPPLRSDIADKIHMLRCFAPAKPFPTETPEAMANYWRALVAEIPAFLHHCCGVRPPPGREDARFGVAAFHHPDLVLALEAQSQERALLELIDLELWSDVTLTEWEGTALELETRLLSASSAVREQARKLFHFSGACGSYLGRLAKAGDSRVRSCRTMNARRWLISKPQIMTP